MRPRAVVAGVMEKGVNLRHRFEGPCLGLGIPRPRVALTRTTDRNIPHRERLRLAEELGATLYLPIQTNAVPSPQAHGVET